MASYVASGGFVETATKDSAIIPSFPEGNTVSTSAGKLAVLHVVCSAFGTGSVTPTIVGPLSGWRQLGWELYASGFANTRSPRQRLYLRALSEGDTRPSLQMTGGTNNGTSARIGARIHIFDDVGVIRFDSSFGNIGDAAPLVGTTCATKSDGGLVAAFTGMGDANTISGQTWGFATSITERTDDVVSNRLAVALTTAVQASAGLTGIFNATPSGTVDPWCVHVLAMESEALFPTESTLDDFNRSDSSSLGENWTPDTFNFGNFGLDIISNAAGNDTALDERSYYSAVPAGADGEAVAFLIATGSGSDRIYVGYRVADPDQATVDGYEAIFEPGASYASLWRIDNKSYTAILELAQALQVGDGVGVRFEGDSHELYVTMAPGPRLHLGTVTDDTYLDDGYVALGIRGTGPRVGAFLAGPLVTGDVEGSASTTVGFTADALLSAWVNFSAEGTLSVTTTADAGTPIAETDAGHVTADSGEIGFSGSQALADAGLVTVDAAAPSMRFVYNLTSAGLATADGVAPTHNGFPAPVGRNKFPVQLGVPGSGDLVRGSVGVPGSTE